MRMDSRLLTPKIRWPMKILATSGINRKEKTGFRWYRRSDLVENKIQ